MRTLPLFVLVTVVVVAVVVVVVVVWNSTTTEFCPLTPLNVAYMITDEALSYSFVQNEVLLSLMVLLPKVIFLSRNSMMYLTAHPVSSRFQLTRRLLQSPSSTGKNPLIITGFGMTKMN